MAQRPLHSYERLEKDCPCFCPSCGKDFKANVIYDDYKNHLVKPSAIICDNCQDSPLAKMCNKILKGEY